MSGEKKHPGNMSKDELLELYFTTNWMALDLAQHLDFTMAIKEELVMDAVKAATQMAYDIVYYAQIDPQTKVTPGIATFDGSGGFS